MPERIEVVDGASGETIAVGQLEWIGGRGSRYNHFHWHGNKEGKPFDDIHGLHDGESTWSDIVARVMREEANSKIKRIEAEVVAKQKELEALKKQSGQ